MVKVAKYIDNAYIFIVMSVGLGVVFHCNISAASKLLFIVFIYFFFKYNLQWYYMYGYIICFLRKQNNLFNAETSTQSEMDPL